ncbi:hypothetical protein LX32DRAFT_186330 [Colletotrichum zoysiae]|uniref:Uncharacterized protein n=1 Tax=Colletotrichum zoysiae TaxID=1216348 RepID=A0AAD9H6W0_9PEZI|nr:hypothetical protein LX32DRAFT_186330 [Colletotrichum zoysiae]
MLVSFLFSHFQIACSPNSRKPNGQRLVVDDDDDGSIAFGAPVTVVSPPARISNSLRPISYGFRLRVSHGHPAG